jgi:hypothetical protein
VSRKNTYIALGVVFVASMAAAFSLPLGRVIRELAGVSVIGSLFGALLQIARDRIAHERSLRILESQNSFSIGATSHMAGVAFDKYSSFCEEYVAEMFNALMTLGREGPRKTVLPHADNLLMIRRKWSVWLTPTIDKDLQPFENALRTIGAEAWIQEQAPGEGDTKAMYSTFAKVIGLEQWRGEPLTDELTVTAVINQLRRVLGTEELSRLRNELVTRALRNVGNSA